MWGRSMLVVVARQLLVLDEVRKGWSMESE